MATYILTWNPDKWNWAKYERRIAETAAGRLVRGRWSTGNRRDIDPGSRFFMLRQSRDRGIIAAGYTISHVREVDHWDGSERTSKAVRIEYETILPVADVLPVEDLIAADLGVNWHRIQASGIRVPDGAAERLESMWQHHLAAIGNQPTPLPDEVPAPARFIEGAARRVYVNAYERSREARDACIEHHGSKCAVCEFDFGTFYGPIGEGFIHVHHLRDLASIGAEYEVDPVRDLRPVCPNCHAMLHQDTPAMGVEKLRRMISAHAARA